MRDAGTFYVCYRAADAPAAVLLDSPITVSTPVTGAAESTSPAWPSTYWVLCIAGGVLVLLCLCLVCLLCLRSRRRARQRPQPVRPEMLAKTAPSASGPLRPPQDDDKAPVREPEASAAPGLRLPAAIQDPQEEKVAAFQFGFTTLAPGLVLLGTVWGEHHPPPPPWTPGHTEPPSPFNRFGPIFPRAVGQFKKFLWRFRRQLL